MTPPVALTVAAEPRAKTAANAPAVGPFVVNLCSSTTPMALTQPQDPELKRFKFFVSRRLEDGRERFRLHMGYFETLHEAEEWVAVAREFYPGAWAGEAPGKHLGARGHAVPPANNPSARTEMPPAPSPDPVPPVLRAAPDERPAPVLELLDEPHPPRATPSTAGTANRASPLPERPPSDRTVVPPAARGHVTNATERSQEPALSPQPPAEARGRSNVREVLAALDDTHRTREMPAPHSAGAAPSAETLSDSQVLKILEDRRADGRTAEPDTTVALLKPDDTGTRRALQRAVAQRQPVFFAVQLQWSVQPIDVAKVPPLAIFGAYTLYSVEGSRQGRRWYGLRLGFFSDAISAKQVAHYVRSEFASVAVIPVSAQERSRASGSTGKAPQAAPRTRSAVVTPAGAPPARSASPVRDRLPEPTAEFKLLDDEPSIPRIAEATFAKARAGGARSTATKTPHSRVRAGERRSPHTLEETLEILGADELEIDTPPARTATSQARTARPQPRRDSPFAKFLDRLSERSHRTR